MSAVAPLPSALPAAPRPLAPRLRLAALLLLPLGVALGVAGTRYLAPAPTPTPSAPPPESHMEPTSVKFARDRWESAGIKTEPAAAAPLLDYAWRTGRVVMNEERVAHLFPPVEGIVREVRAKLGQDVAAGQVLAVVDSKEVGQAKLDLVTARVALTAETEREQWIRTTAANTIALIAAVDAGKPALDIDAAFKDRPVGDRRQTVMTAYTTRNQLKAQYDAQRENMAVSPATFRKTEADYQAAEAAYRALVEEMKFQAKQQARQAELKLKETAAAFDVARTRLLTLGYTPGQVEKMDPVAEGPAASHFEVKAPFPGTVVGKHAVQSERVNAQFQLFELTDLSGVWVQADAFETDLPLVRGLTGKTVMFRAPGAGIGERPATVFYAGDLVDRASRTVTVTATAPNPDRVLKPGMYIEVGLPRGSSAPVLQVPAAAVQWDHGKAFVFVLTGNDDFRQVDVELGREAGDRYEVKAGLKAGDAVVTEGAFVLKSELFRDQLVGE
jgi:RND family efflux transporter MFP subunit